MERKTFIIYLIISILSIIYTAIVYYGYDRLFMLKIFGCKRYTEKYVRLPRANSKSKVIISMQTSSKHLLDHKPNINSILDQTVHPDQIIVSINKDTSLEVPDYIKDANIILLHTLSQDYDKCASFISPLLREKDASTKIIIVGGNQIYGADFIQCLVDESEKFPEEIIYIKGYNGKKFVQDNDKKDYGIDNDIVDLNEGVLIKPKFFPADIISNDSRNILCNAPNATLSAKKLATVKLHQLKYSDNFGQNPNSDDEKEKTGTRFFAAYLKSF